MTERKLSTLGYLMDRLGLSTAALARRLHVDASLVSKWRSGSRRLSAKSVYFDEVCRMLLEQNPMALTDALRSLVPLEEPKREEGESRKRGDGSLSEEEISGTEGISGGSSGTEALLYRVLNDGILRCQRHLPFALRHSVQRRLPYIPAEREGVRPFPIF